MDEIDPEHEVTRGQLKDGLSRGFPWHRWEVAHPELCDPDKWWSTVGAVIERP